MAIKFANRMDNIKASFIRELLKLTQRDDLISFAGGMPAPEFFPIEEMKKITIKVLEEDGQKALQYGPTDGFIPLREKIAERMNKTTGTKNITAENILITAGSQQGLDFSGKIFLNPDDVVVCESPSYLGAINAFKAYECKFADIPTDDEGMIMEDLEKTLQTVENIKFIYVIADFQNPTGKTWSVDRRKKLIELANKYDTIIVEDNPYYEMRYEGEIPPSIKSFDTEDRVIFLGTFSKIFCPGLRMGWVCAEPELLNKYNLVKQGADLQVSSIAQREINAFMDMYDMDARIKELVDVYRKRKDAMVNSINKYFPENVKFSYPEGGLFLWIELPEHINATKMMDKTLEKKVAYVPGESFFPNGGGLNTARLNFSAMPEDKIEEGIKRLAEVIKEM